MVREDILGGLKSALLRGYTLKDAMISFYNAGYTKEDIEDAARKLQYQLVENKELREMVNPSAQEAAPNTPNLPKPPQANKLQYGHANTRTMEPLSGKAPSAGNKKEKSFTIELNHNKEKSHGKKSKKQISNYGQNLGVRVATITLVVVLLVLVGALIGIILFKDPIVQFFNNVLK